ncbi:sialate O-acetylesterase [Pedobacter arcticus]|uniref:sialate O-acetylesterase n=1 Tax=Pedobacter arcticus TaxID=752140 RepID=UPI000301FF7B|nr:sialate O-acetylesterase [Pedobacter arcticus]
MKKFFYILCICLISLSKHTFGQQDDQKDLDIYILMGQSNMAGRGDITATYKEQQHNRVVMLNKDNKWVKAMHPLHFDKPKVVGVGPGLSFGIAMAEAYPNKKIALVPCAVGGTAISKWVPGAYDMGTQTHPYDDAVKRIRYAMHYGTIKGVIWHQGEGDSGSKSSQYIDNLTALIARIRKEIDNPQLPFIVGELGTFRSTSHNINDVLPQLVSKVSYTNIVSAEGLVDKGDKTHFDSPSATELGRRFAVAMLQIQGETPIGLKRKEQSRLKKNNKKESELLFDAHNPNKNWRSIKGNSFPTQGWKLEEEVLTLLPGGKGGDIITREKFSNFELALDYKLSDSANTGIKYFVSALEDSKGKWQLNGPEFQLIDDFKHESVKNNKSPETSTASLYLLYAPKGKKLSKPGEWNQIKIVAKGDKVEHWINGKRVLSYQRGSNEFRKLVSKTKFSDYQTPYGEAKEGYILIQDHKDQASFRNIRITRIK